MPDAKLVPLASLLVLSLILFEDFDFLELEDRLPLPVFMEFFDSLLDLLLPIRFTLKQ